MNDSMAQNTLDNQASRDTLVHDLRGPTLNAKAFSNEINESITRLCELMRDSSRTLSSDERLEISEILESDLVVCVDFLHKALLQLEQRLAELNNSGTR